MRTPLEKRLPVVAGLVVGIAAAAVVGGSAWLRLVVLAAVVLVWGVMLHYVFGLPWNRITRYRESASESAESRRVSTRR